MRKSILILLLIGSGFCSYAYGLDWKRLHEQADETDVEQAEEKVAQNPDSVKDLYVMALVYLNNHKYAQADATFKDIVAVEPDLPEGRWGLAEILRRNKKIKESEELLVNVIDSKPEFSPAYISLAYLRYMEADFKETVRLARKVIDQGRAKVDLSNYVRAYALLAGAKGMLASQGGPLSKVINGTQVLPNLKKAEELQPDSPAVLFGFGSFYFLAPAIAGGDVDKAEKYLQRAIAADPLFADAYVRLAQVYKSRGDDKRYREYIDKALEIDPDNDLAKDQLSGKCTFNCVTVEE